MLRLVALAVVHLLANAIALVVGAQVLTDMSLSVGGFVVALLVFTLTGMLIEPLVRQIAIKNVPAILGSSALVATLVSLIVTAVVSDGLKISGATTWVLATVLVWAVALVTRLVAPFVIFKRILRGVSDGRARTR